MKKRRRKKKYLGKKLFNTTFVVTYVSFIGFLYLFATRVTPWDIDYFIKDTQQYTTHLVSSIKTKKAELDAKRETAALAKALSKEQKNRDNASANKNDKEDEEKEIILESSTVDLVYFSQTDPRWNTTIYGTDNIIGVYGCGPTTLAMVLSTFTDNDITPDMAATWAYDNGHFCDNSGSYHSIIPDGANAFGLTSESLKNPSKETIFNELNQGNLVVVLMNKGIFTSQGHFIILRGVTPEGKVLIADSQNAENSQQPWDLQTILDEAKYSASYGGPFWSISNRK
ncbi:C39 family peptidase [Anaerotignum sp. MB30-C6]|uniref:C39 family peptidase n=1 Tax=Anaerotignum sp. MB30-C6 TaxID=3070814 RepID=UPI0027DAD376|nr:C39 family peptidase [Anaerotignum sp. MB30-C6]WMI80956.1 C39 family peptidase [Anaerotignum sp. MB30-C6]